MPPGAYLLSSGFSNSDGITLRLRYERTNQRDQWLQDVRDRQNNIVFPQTLANETRLWRNIGTRPATSLTWAGLTILGIFVFGFTAVLLVIFIRAGEWVEVLAGLVATLVVFGPIIGLVVWATRRNLRKLEKSRHKSREGKL
jgi:hypothetical protein